MPRRASSRPSDGAFTLIGVATGEDLEGVSVTLCAGAGASRAGVVAVVAAGSVTVATTGIVIEVGAAAAVAFGLMAGDPPREEGRDLGRPVVPVLGEAPRCSA